MRRLNLIFLMGMVTAGLALSGALYLAHNRQVARNASALLLHAHRTEERGDAPATCQVLRRYLNLKPADQEAWRWYARILDQVLSGADRGNELYLVYQEALRHNPDDRSLERRCVDLALELRPQRTADARRYLGLLQLAPAEALKKDQRAVDAARELAELKELEGKCLLLESDYQTAANAFSEAIFHDPARLSCYMQLARLERGELRRNPRDPDARIEQMVASNSRSGLAHLYRFRYASEFRLPAADSDLKEALALAPEDSEVLLTAALVAEQRKDPDGARSLLEKAQTLHPQNVELALASARLELREKRPDRAESVLRRSYRTYKNNPPVDLLFLLAEALIVQDKIEGSDGARVFMVRLEQTGYRESYVQFLEALLEVQNKRWNTAVSRIESALAVVKAEPQMSTRLSLMLAECYSQLGWDERRLEALRIAGQGPSGSESARLALARSLAESNDFDDALAILLPLSESRPELRLDIARLSLEKTQRQPIAARDWKSVEQRVDEARKAQPEATESLELLRADLLAAQEKWDAARAVLTAAQSRNPGSLKYRLALAKLAESDRATSGSLQILDQAEKDLGPQPEIRLARLEFWARRGGGEARSAVAQLADARARIPTAECTAFLDRLAMTELRLGEPALARQHLRELSALQPDNIRVLLARFDLALAAGDQADATELVENLRNLEGEQGTHWRFAHALELIDRAVKGDSTGLQAAQNLAAELAAKRPGWWGVSLLGAELAELRNQPDQALDAYMEAVEQGNSQPAVIRHLVRLILERNRLEAVERLARLVRNKDVARAELTALAGAIDALSKGDANHALERVREVVAEDSRDLSDQLILGRFLAVASQSAKAETHFRRALELGPGVPATTLSYVQFLVSTKQIEKARAFVAAAAKTQPANRPSLTLALCSMLIGDNNQAESQIQSVLEANPEDPAALRRASLSTCPAVERIRGTSCWTLWNTMRQMPRPMIWCGLDEREPLC